MHVRSEIPQVPRLWIRHAPRRLGRTYSTQQGQLVFLILSVSVLFGTVYLWVVSPNGPRSGEECLPS